MAEIKALQSLAGNGTYDSLSNEKSVDKESGSIEVAQALDGDVYDDIRAIDLGEDGKERPIGKIIFTII